MFTVFTQRCRPGSPKNHKTLALHFFQNKFNGFALLPPKLNGVCWRSLLTLPGLQSATNTSRYLKSYINILLRIRIYKYELNIYIYIHVYLNVCFLFIYLSLYLSTESMYPSMHTSSIYIYKSYHTHSKPDGTSRWCFPPRNNSIYTFWFHFSLNNAGTKRTFKPPNAPVVPAWSWKIGIQ